MMFGGCCTRFEIDGTGMTPTVIRFRDCDFTDSSAPLVSLDTCFNT